MTTVASLDSPLQDIHSDLYPDINEGHPEMYWQGIAVSILSCAAYALPFFTTFPLSGTIQIVALGVLAAVGYGIVNDQLACRQCIHYFTVGHTHIHRRLLATEDPTLNGIVWGIHSTWVLGVIGGVVMALAARITSLVAASALQLTPWVAALSIGVCAFSHWKSVQEEQKWKDPALQELLNDRFHGIIYPEMGYHPVDLKRIPEDHRAAYLGVGARNQASYLLMPAFGLAMAVGTFVCRILASL